MVVLKLVTSFVRHLKKFDITASYVAFERVKGGAFKNSFFFWKCSNSSVEVVAFKVIFPFYMPNISKIINEQLLFLPIYTITLGSNTYILEM